MSEIKKSPLDRGWELPPPLELECLSALWRLRVANVKQVRAALEPGRCLAYTTVMTLLERLARKGFVVREKHGRSFHYRPVIAREAVQRTAVQQLASRLFDGSTEDLLRFLETDSGSSATADTAIRTPAGSSSLDASLL